MSIQIEVKPVADFSETEATALAEMKKAVYPVVDAEVEANRSRQWEHPRWGVMVTADEELVSYTGVVLRAGAVGDEPRSIGGLGSIATHPAHRGKGYAALGIGRALDYLLGQGADFALLVCRDELVAYYQSFGFRLFEGKTFNTQNGARELFTFNRVMVGDLNGAAPLGEIIDLKGPAW